MPSYIEKGAHLLKGTLEFEGPAPCGTHDLGKPGQAVVGHHVEESAHSAGRKLDEVKSTCVASDLLPMHLQTLVSNPRRPVLDVGFDEFLHGCYPLPLHCGVSLVVLSLVVDCLYQCSSYIDTKPLDGLVLIS